MKHREPMPGFCAKCIHMRQTIFTGNPYCKQQCKYNPEHRISAWRSFYQRRVAVADAV